MLYLKKTGGAKLSKLVSLQEAAAKIPDGASIMFGGFMANGTAEKIIDALVEKT